MFILYFIFDGFVVFQNAFRQTLYYHRYYKVIGNFNMFFFLQNKPFRLGLTTNIFIYID